MDKRLYRSRTNKIIGGVCGGIAEYFGLDPTLVRIITVLLILLPGIGVLTYLVAWLIIPQRPLGQESEEQEYKFSPWNKYLPGIILIAFGVILLTREYFFYFDWGDFWPIVLILVGAGLILIGWNRQSTSKIPNGHPNHNHWQNGGNAS